MYTLLRAPSAATHARPPRRAHHPRLRTRTQPPVDMVLLHVIHEAPSDNCEICARRTRAEGVKEACGGHVAAVARGQRVGAAKCAHQQHRERQRGQRRK